MTKKALGYYTLAEIDRLRVAESIRVGWHAKASEVEDRVRTLMTNGTRPEEVERAAQEIVKAFTKAQRDLITYGEAPRRG